MSVRVVLRSGKVLTYNLARLPLDVVERAEFERPCRIRREPRLKDRGIDK